MALNRAEAIAATIVAIWIAAFPAAILLAPTPSPLPPAADAAQPASAAIAAPPIDAALARPLFGATAPEPMPDLPELVGIAGRLNVDAVALVRSADGSTRTLAIGESIDGWRLQSLAIDAAGFARGGRQVRVAMPGSDGAPAQ
ncbi:hypothetical protein [Sphingomonas baiyangensis]|uniref:Uncharacterized protein n=1 Tax=Sphingomonas baiyangensis TaxID=2572576 RepID=A0A4U1L9P8_9SPHN|nr:hypothetical protein [Sphingomonas baiyangensis]TKD53120.1 hypothetical protein FBR43_01930 [Sphingomonas baiyangensis]